MYFQIYPSIRGLTRQWAWRLRAANHQIIATSGESYYNKNDCLHAVGLVKGTSTFTPVYESNS